MQKATIDRTANMSYIYLSKGEIAYTTHHDDYNIDYDAEHNIIGIEIFGIIDLEDIT